MTRPLKVENDSAADCQNGKSIEQTFVKMTLAEQILLRPETFVGQVEKGWKNMWTYSDPRHFVYSQVCFSPALYKLFDEILLNAADNKRRDDSMDSLKVDISANTISVFNNGAGVPVEMHRGEGVYVPEMIFGQLLTSSNYDDSQDRTTVGRNGYGAKLANLFSTKFTIETADGSRQKRYKQVFSNNMRAKSAPIITKCKANESWTRVTFSPDLSRFYEALELDSHIISVMKKRVLDVAGCLGSSVKVQLNGKRVPVKCFRDYAKMFLDSNDYNVGTPSEDKPSKFPLVYEKLDDRWEVCVRTHPKICHGGKVSFVNGIETTEGGGHVDILREQVVRHVLAAAQKQVPDLQVYYVNCHLWIFVNCVLNNPTFSTQTKEFLSTPRSSFGSQCKVSPKFLREVEKCGIVEAAINTSEMYLPRPIPSKIPSQSTLKPKGVTQLDAHYAGGSRSQECTLILTEGDSATALAMAGIKVVGRHKYGCYSLQEKLENVRGMSLNQASTKNKDIADIMACLGLEHDEDTTKLRYGHVMIMSSQDEEGSQLKGRIINFFDSFWPSLVDTPSFLLEFTPPIVKATHELNGRVLSFYNMLEYTKWAKATAGDAKQWGIKYYKEAKEYFGNLTKHTKTFTCGVADDYADAIAMVFHPNDIEGRKAWIQQFKPGTFLDDSVDVIPFSDFFNKKLLQFCVSDLARFIPSAVDGLTSTQRKILFCSFKKNFVKQEKVVQFSGYVLQHSAPNLGSEGLDRAVIGMAQNHVGSNNINFLEPIGQFGTRNKGGKDHGNSRHIFTKLSPITRLIFCQSDDRILNYLKEDGQEIEPKWYAPIIPMVLVNGTEGIVGEWKTFVPKYNPQDIVKNIRNLLRDEPAEPIEPWYKGFEGTIAAENGSSIYTVSGVIKQVTAMRLKITELPIRVWTWDYQKFLDGLLLEPLDTDEPSEESSNELSDEPGIKSYVQNSTDSLVHFDMNLSKENMASAMSKGLAAVFRLTQSINSNNMYLFDADGIIRKYNTPEQILEEFYHIRLKLYEKRKADQLSILELELLKLGHIVRFIASVSTGAIVPSKHARSDLLELLKVLDFPAYSEISNPRKATIPTIENTRDLIEYDYLLRLAIEELTIDNLQQLCSQRKVLEREVEELRTASCKDLWEKDLDLLLIQLDAEDSNNRNRNYMATRSSAYLGVDRSGDNPVKMETSERIENSEVSKRKATREHGRKGSASKRRSIPSDSEGFRRLFRRMRCTSTSQNNPSTKSRIAAKDEAIVVLSESDTECAETQQRMEVSKVRKNLSTRVGVKRENVAEEVIVTETSDTNVSLDDSLDNEDESDFDGDLSEDHSSDFDYDGLDTDDEDRDDLHSIQVLCGKKVSLVRRQAALRTVKPVLGDVKPDKRRAQAKSDRRAAGNCIANGASNSATKERGNYNTNGASTSGTKKRQQRNAATVKVEPEQLTKEAVKVEPRQLPKEKSVVRASTTGTENQDQRDVAISVNTEAGQALALQTQEIRKTKDNVDELRQGVTAMKQEFYDLTMAACTTPVNKQEESTESDMRLEESMESYVRLKGTCDEPQILSSSDDESWHHVN